MLMTVSNRRWCQWLVPTHIIRILCQVGLALVADAALLCQGYGQQPHPDQHEISQLRSLELECKENLERVNAALTAEQQPGASISTYLSRELSLWQQLELVVARRLAAYEDRGFSQQSMDGNRAAAAAFPAPSTFLELDETRELLEAAERSLESRALELASAKALAQDTRRKLEEVEQLLRRLTSEFKRSRLNPPPMQRQEQTLLKLQRRLFTNQLALEHEQIELLEALKASALRDVADLEQLVASYANRFQLTREELNKRLALIDETEAKISLQMAHAQARLHEMLQQDNAKSQFAYTAAYEESQLLQQLAAEIGDVKECWRRRYALSNSTLQSSDVDVWLQEAQLAQQQLTRIAEQLRLRTEQHQQQLAASYRARILKIKCKSPCGRGPATTGK